MKKFVIFSLVGVGIIGALVVVLIYLQMKETKSFSPEEQVSFKQDDLTLTVLYNRPYKKGREIFGALVPFDQVWRTGANEATTFETNKDIEIEGKTLKAGKYSLWAIPGRDKWKIIFNSEYGQWGINSKGEANRDPKNDVLSIDVIPIEQNQVFEQFTISFNESGEDAEMVLAWDKTLVMVPIEQ